MFGVISNLIICTSYYICIHVHVHKCLKNKAYWKKKLKSGPYEKIYMHLQKQQNDKESSCFCFLWPVLLCFFSSDMAKKKICEFTVTRPTLIFGPDPKGFYGTFDRKLYQMPHFTFKCCFEH